MKRLPLLLIVTMSMAISGCALVFKGERSQVAVQSDIAGAEIYIDGVKQGETPLRLELKSDRSYVLVIKKNGYTDQNYVINNRIGALWVILDVISGLVPLIIDAATGAWYELDQSNINVVLTPRSFTPAPLPSH